MKFNVGVNFRMTAKGSKYQSKSYRSHIIAHAERYKGKNVKYYKSHNVDLSKSKWVNDYYKTKYSNVYDILKDQFKAKADKHDKTMIKTYQPKKCYGDKEKGISAIDGYLGKYTKQGQPRWLKPLRTVPLKFCTMNEKSKLIQLCLNNGYTYQQYANIVNRGYRGYVNDFNKNNAHMKITMSLSNLDEAGGDHAHIEYLALGTTKGGKPSLSFNRAVAQTIKGGIPSSYNKRMAKFRIQQGNKLLSHLSKSFKESGLNISLNMVSHARNKNSYIPNIELYKQTMRAVDEANAKKKQAETKEAEANASRAKINNQSIIAQTKANRSFQRLVVAMNSLKKENERLAHRNAYLAQNQQTPNEIPELRDEIKKLKRLNKLTQQSCRGRLATVLRQLPTSATLTTQIEKQKKKIIELRQSTGIHNASINYLKNYNHTLRRNVIKLKRQLDIANQKLDEWGKALPYWQKALNTSQVKLRNSTKIQKKLSQELPSLNQHGKLFQNLLSLSEPTLVGFIYSYFKKQEKLRNQRK